MESPISVPKYTLKRLPLYYRSVQRHADMGEDYISSEAIAQDVNVNAVQVRKDMTLFGAFGRPGVGYSVQELKAFLEDILGLNNVKEAVLVGCGHLGRAIISYSGFSRYGLSIAAVFDSDPALIGQKLAGKTVFDVAKLRHIIERLHIPVGIVTVPASSAQDVANTMVEAGIKGIWNFAPVILQLPSSVYVRNEDLASGLATLFHHLK